MTNGMVVVLGETGQNFAAGMSAGVAYVLDPEGVFPVRCNTELVDLHRLDDPGEAEALREVIGWHARKTRSKHSSSILDNWENLRHAFWRVLPRGSTTSATVLAVLEHGWYTVLALGFVGSAYRAEA